ncbi:neprilysin-2-like isoform X3 [Homarus americanus]|uniref:neprilysin-2-like isoform X3 n=1 Tax=Homarus americanus TaxID=6706 RepID=UPI001C491578|nr:neprilysin-2-like isoform X3 [Homarus americanus]
MVRKIAGQGMPLAVRHLRGMFKKFSKTSDDDNDHGESSQWLLCDDDHCHDPNYENDFIPTATVQPGWFGRRTRMERYLMLAATTVVFVVVALAISLASVIYGYRTGILHGDALTGCPDTTTSTGGSSDVCLTQGCVKAAASLVDSMDQTVNPCEDFFKFACGGFLKTKIIPDDKTALSRFNEVSDDLQEKLRGLVEAEETSKDSPSTKMVKALYKSCTNTESIKKHGLEPLKGILKKMGGWPVLEGDTWKPSAFQWTSNIYINRQLGYSLDYIFDFSVTTNIKNSTWRIIDIDQPPLGMPSRKYLLKGLNDSDVQAYYNYQVNLAELLGADRTRAMVELKESLEFEIQLANFSLPKEERRNATKLYNKMTIKELQEMVPEIPWLEYINSILTPFFTVTIQEPVIVNVPSYVKKLGKLLIKTPKRVIANYMLWRVTAASVSFLSEDARDIQLEYSKKLVGKGTREPRWKECMRSVSGSLSHAVGSMYARTFFKEDAKAAADEMVRYIRAEFKKILENIDWMDEATRIRALKKAEAITPHIAYPPELLIDDKLTELYDGLEISSGELLENMRNMTIFGTDYSFKRLREKIDKKDWRNHGSAAVVNAFYSPLENSIQFPAGILQGTFFGADRPKYMNFGAIGYVIGHEITHGFDDSGRQFDAKGDLRDWWEKETKEKFLKKAKCIIEQYGNYTAPEVNLNLNGINTQGENIADNGGIKESYMAYNQWVKDNGEEKTLPSLPYSTKQLFWISAANAWCGKYRPETLKLRILTGAHSPAQFRVNGPFSNQPEFAHDWKCPAGSTLNPSNRCSVW